MPYIFDRDYWRDPHRVVADMARLQEAIATIEENGGTATRISDQLAELAAFAELAMIYHRTGQKLKLPPQYVGVSRHRRNR